MFDDDDGVCMHELTTSYPTGDNCFQFFLRAILDSDVFLAGSSILIYAHNGGKFDHLFFPRAIHEWLDPDVQLEHLADGPNSYVSVHSLYFDLVGRKESPD